MTIMAKKKKKKGRPSLLDLQKRSLKQQQLLLQSQNPNFSNPRGRPNRVDPTELVAADEDDERKEKKHKLVLGFNSESDPIRTTLSFSDDPDVSLNRRKISDSSEKVLKATDNSVVGHGLQVDSGPTTPLPDKKLLEFILDRLQKKDTHGVFSEPVDPEQIHDYYEIIANPMDFGTVRKKLDCGAYINLEQFENDILLICSNAMEYNASDTIFFKQARSIQELAKKDFENLREESDDGEPPPPPKIVRKGRPPGKKLKPETSTSECVAPETFSNSTNPPIARDNSTGPSGYNLRKGPIPNKFRFSDAINGISLGAETCPSWVSEWENEFPSLVLRSVLKYGSKRFSVDENKRDTYMISSGSTEGPNTLSLLDGEPRRLVEVGDPYLERSYTRSLAQFTAGLGPVVRKIASMKIERILSAPVWPEENKAPQNAELSFFERKDIRYPAANDYKSMLLSQTTSCSNPIRGLPNQSNLAPLHSNDVPSFVIQQNSILQPCTNVPNGDRIPCLQPQMGMLLQPDTLIGRHGKGEASVPSQMLGAVSDKTNLLAVTGRGGSGDFLIPQGSGLGFEGEEESVRGLSSSQTFCQSEADVGFQPISVRPIGSSAQPDLALQLRMGW